MKNLELLYLSQKDVISCGVLQMKGVIDILEQVFLLHYQKQDILPAKVALRWGDAHSEETRGRINAMPGFIGGTFNTAGIKWIGSAPQNPFQFNLPRASALIILNDPETMFPYALMDGTLISAMRTGGVTGVAAKYCARKDARVAALIGAGTQNRTQLMALKEVLPALERVFLYDIKEERSRSFALEVEQIVHLPIEIAPSAEDAVRKADIVVSATTAREPVVLSEWLKPGIFYSHVGGYETDYRIVRKAHKIVVDDWYQIKHRKTQTLALMFEEGKIDDSAIYAELGELVAYKKPGREGDHEIIYFNSVGMAIEDIAVAKWIYQTACSKGIGTKLEIWDTPLWV